MEHFIFDDEESNQPSSSLQMHRREQPNECMPPLVQLGRQLLVKAQEGDTEGVRQLMKQGAPFTVDWLGTSAIHWACQHNHYDTAELLLKAGISRDSRNKVDRTPLHVVASEGYVEILKLLLDHGVDVDCIDMLMMTPLHWAAEYGHEECVRLLLENGASPMALNKFGKTPDQIAFDNNYLEITHMIQEYAESPLFEERQKAAKEKLKRAAAAHKEAVDRERALIMKTAIANGSDKKMLKLNNFTAHTMMEPILIENCDDESSTLTGGVVEHAEPEPSEPLNTGLLALQTEQQPIEFPIEKSMALLKAHGIQMLPKDNSTIVESAVSSGQKVMLTEAGKIALTLTQLRGPNKQPSPLKLKKGMPLPRELLKGKKFITIRADQLISMKNQRKVIIRKATPGTQPAVDMTRKSPKLDVVLSQNVINCNNLFVPKPNRLPVAVAIAQKRPVMKIAPKSDFDRLQQELIKTKNELRLLKAQYLRQTKVLASYKLRYD